MIITDGVGQGYSAKVTKQNQIQAYSESVALQHYVSINNGQAYQVIGDFTSMNNSTHTILHIKNDDPDRNLILTYVRMSTVDQAGGTAPPSAGQYWQMGFGRTVSSGGTAVTPVNMNRDSGNSATVTVTDNNPTMTGTFTEIDRHYIDGEADEHTYNKEGTIILGLNDTFEVRVTTSSTSGTAYCRASFLMIDPKDV